MPTADNTPDFDSMSPEELMAWMESLAKRQGATEGFTTDADMEVAEVDPTTAQVDEPGYIPYGMDPEKWKVKQAEEDAAKAVRMAASPPPPAPAPVAAAPPPAPQPEPVVAAASGGQPDFDSMSPEELMAWMESLAKRQGAVEGFTTAADMELAEVDPDTAQVDEPGYIPYGMDPEKWKVKQAEEAAAKAARAPAPIPVTPPPAPEPEPILDMPQFDLPMLEAEDELSATQPTPAAQDDAMSWLESLAADQGMSFPEMDLSSLDTQLPELTPEPEAATDPMTWLESLAQGDDDMSLPSLDFDDDVEETLPAASAASGAIQDPLETGADPVAWLESLAKRQGASAEELVTSADLNIPMPDELGDAGPGYTDYSFEKEDDIDTLDVPLTLEKLALGTETDASELEDPEAWLDSLASAQGFDPRAEESKPSGTSSTDTDIMEALKTGKFVPADEMQAWMERQFDRAEDEPDDVEEEESFDPNAPAVKAELPTWLLDQMGTPPAIEQVAPPEAPLAFEQLSAIEAIPESEMPDWLSMGETSEEASVESIFAPEEPASMSVPVVEPPAPAVSSITDEFKADATDPWVVAFEQERAQSLTDITNVPDWYADRMESGDAEVTAPTPAASASPAAELQPAALQPEAELVAGQPEAMPDWLADFATSTEEEPVAVAGDMPDWLVGASPVQSEAFLEVHEEPVVASGDLPDWLTSVDAESHEIPDWLIDTLQTDEQAAVPQQPAAQQQVYSPPPAPVQNMSPVPVPSSAKIDVPATLTAARGKLSSGDVEGSLQDYESVIRANAQLDVVVTDLSKLVDDKVHKENPAVYRVLGDGLMRQGKLQAALDTYRKALNLL